jgi:hypothetical protein
MYQRLEAELINRFDDVVRTAGDLDRAFRQIKTIAKAETRGLPGRGAGGGAAMAGASPRDPKVGDLKAGGQTPPAASAASGAKPSGQNAGAGAAPKAPAQAAAPSNATGASSASAPGTVNPSQTTAPQGSNENLKTYSSKPYHGRDGWVFNPSIGLWQDPDDPSQTRNPDIITCCDDTGLAFPSDSVEAHQDNVWNMAGVDPNCGRLYSCDDADAGAATDSDAPPEQSWPTDKDEEIRAALQFLRDQYPDPLDFIMARRKFLQSLPYEYRRRAEQILFGAHSGRVARIQRNVPTGSPSRGQGAGQYAGSSPSSQSTITGLGGVSSSYVPMTRTAAQNIVNRYQSIPGGVTLEGGSPDLAFIKSVAYEPRANAFVLNDDLVYLNPIAAKEFAEISRSLATDDKLGVSLGRGLTVYGNVSPRSSVTVSLKMTDRFLGSIVFGRTKSIEMAGYRFAPGYRAADSTAAHAAVYFNIHAFRFAVDEAGELKRSDARVDMTLVPLDRKVTDDGRHLPDYDLIDRGSIPAEWLANLKHVQDNFAYYGRERIVQRAIAHGEAAAFARALNANGVKKITVRPRVPPAGPR